MLVQNANKKSQRRSRKACRSRRVGRNAYRSHKARMHGGVKGVKVSIYNKLPATEEINIIHKPPQTVLNTLIVHLENFAGVGDVFARDRETTRVQLISDLRNGELVLYQIDPITYAIIRKTDSSLFASPSNK
jgi:hypothetical protein